MAIIQSKNLRIEDDALNIEHYEENALPKVRGEELKLARRNIRPPASSAPNGTEAFPSDASRNTRRYLHS